MPNRRLHGGATIAAYLTSLDRLALPVVGGDGPADFPFAIEFMHHALLVSATRSETVP